MTFRAVVLAAVAVVCAGADMESLLTNIAAFEDGQDRKPLVEFAGLVSDSLGSPRRLREIEQRLLRLVQSSATRAGKDFALRQLSMIGTDASVSVLAAMISEKDTGEMARYALARIPGPAASAALRQSLPRTPGNMKIALVNSLGQRRDVLSVPALSALMTGEDARLAESAASALARIANHPPSRRYPQPETRSRLPCDPTYWKRTSSAPTRFPPMVKMQPPSRSTENCSPPIRRRRSASGL